MALWDDWFPASRGDVRKLEKKMSLTQKQLDDLTTQITGLRSTVAATKTEIDNVNTGITGLETRVTTLAQEVKALQDAQGNGDPLDLTNLSAAVDGLATDLSAVKVSADAASTNISTPPVEPA